MFNLMVILIDSNNLIIFNYLIEYLQMHNQCFFIINLKNSVCIHLLNLM